MRRGLSQPSASVNLEMAKHEPGLDDHNKVNYLRAIKRVIGMQPLPMPS